MDMKRTDSLVAATRDLSKHLGKQLFKWLMNDHYANSEKKKPGKRRANLASKMAVLALVHHCWGVCVSALLGGQEPDSPYASVPRLSTLPHGHNGRLPVSILVVAQTQAAPESPVAEHLDERCWVDHSVDPK